MEWTTESSLIVIAMYLVLVRLIMHGPPHTEKEKLEFGETDTFIYFFLWKKQYGTVDAMAYATRLVSLNAKKKKKSVPF